MAADARDSRSGFAGAELKTHPLVEKSLRDAGETQSLVVLVGYVGPSKKDGHVRLYTGLDFQAYYEIPREGVVRAEAVDDEDENGPSQLTVTAHSTIDLVQTSKQTGPASYVAGSIAGAYLAGAGPAGAVRAAVQYPITYQPHQCRPHGPSPMVEPAAGLWGPGIYPTVLCGSLYLCPSQFQWHCHTWPCLVQAPDQAVAYVVQSRFACTALPGCGGTNLHIHC